VEQDIQLLSLMKNKSIEFQKGKCLSLAEQYVQIAGQVFGELARTQLTSQQILRLLKSFRRNDYYNKQQLALLSIQLTKSLAECKIEPLS